MLGLVLLLALGGALALCLRAAWFSEQSFHVTRVHPERPAGLGAARDVEFRTADGLTLRGWYLPSRSGAAVVLVHGLGQSRASLPALTRALGDSGLGVLTFDLRGHGESGGEGTTWGDHERRDVAAALGFLRAQPDVDPARLGAVGFSIGAAAVAATAAQDRGVAAVVLLSPSTSLREGVACDFERYGWISRTGGLLPFWLRGIALDELDTSKDLERIRPRPLMLVTGALEPCRPMTDTLFAQVAGYGHTWLVEGAGHGDLETAAPEAFPRRVTQFLAAALQPPAKGAASRALSVP